MFIPNIPITASVWRYPKPNQSHSLYSAWRLTSIETGAGLMYFANKLGVSDQFSPVLIL